MSLIRKINEGLAMQEFNINLADRNGKLPVIEQTKNDSPPLLYFPRKKLKVKKIHSGIWRSRAWFIQERLRQRAQELEIPTSMTQEALTSGLRSAIIKADSGEYIRLKGVAERNYGQRPWNEIFGICNKSQAIIEQLTIGLLHYFHFPFNAIENLFIEPHMPLNGELPDLGDFLQTFQKLSSGVDTKRKLECENSSIDEFFDRFKGYESVLIADLKLPQKTSFVPAYKIKGDTRLDEVIWHLTKKPLKGEQRQKRNELLRYLCYRAGACKANMTKLGIAWGDGFVETNNHIGNFVVYPNHGITYVGVTDFGRMVLKGDDLFDKKNNITKTNRLGFFEHIEREVKSFRQDFFDTVTCNFPIDLRYRHYSRRLRQECFNAFLTGYATAMYREFRENKTVFPTVKPKTFVIPKNAFMKDKKVREVITDIAT